MNERRWKMVALLATGIAIGVLMVGTPVGAHVSSNWMHNWTAHIRPKADPRYLPGGNLPAGRTIRGTYRITGNDQIATGDLGSTSISFGWTLRSAPTPSFRPVGSLPTTVCPGTAANPQAAPGHLCVYESTGSNVQTQSIVNPVTNSAPGASRFGFNVIAQSAANGVWVTVGTWAVRAP
jgi:hypothetical protein